MAKQKKETLAAAALAAPMLIQRIAAGGEHGLRVLQADLDPLLASNPEYVEVAPPSYDNAEGRLVRATAAGMAAGVVAPASVGSPFGGAPASAPAASADKPAFKIFTGIPIPAAKRVIGVRSSTYPFDDMAVGQSFFYPATADNPKPWKGLGSTVSGANKRFATQSGTKSLTRKNKTTGEQETKQVPNYTLSRKYVVRRVDDGAAWEQPGKAGAVVYREA